MALIDEIRSAYGGGGRVDPKQLSPLILAYVGDTVYDLYVRALLVDGAPRTPRETHLLSSKRVCAAGQSAAFRRIEASLSDEERAVYKRGRNAHSGTTPKNALESDYHAATGLEALVGWLFLSGNDARLSELMKRILESEENH